MNKQQQTPTGRLAVLGLLAALTAALTLLEHWLPPLPVPLARWGLSNITVTAAAWIFGPFGGAAIGVFKAAMVLFTRGTTAAMMAACGTALSVTVTLVMLPLVRCEKITFVGVSVAAAIAHTLGQLLVASWWLSASVFGYGALLTAVAVGSGCLTGLVLNGVMGRLPVGYRKDNRSDGML